MEKLQGKTRKATPVGVIDIGSGFIQLKIAIQDENKYVSVLESVTKSLAVGRETFSEGRISPDMMRELSQCLLGFRQLLREYKVRHVRVVATGAIREAGNREYVLDQIRAVTGFNIEIMNGPEERFLTQQAIQKVLSGYEKMKKEGLLAVNIGSGGVQIVAYGTEGLRYSQNIPMGALRIRRILNRLELQSSTYTKLLEEYINYHVQEVVEPLKGKYKHLVMTGDEVESICRICGELQDMSKSQLQDFDMKQQKIYVMELNEPEKLYERLIYMNSSQISTEFAVSFERAEMLLPSIMIMKAFERASSAKKIYSPSVGLADGILIEMCREKDDQNAEKELLQYTRFFAKQYYYVEKHVEKVVEAALLIFDHLGKKQNLTKRHRLLLEMSAVLHDIGKTVNLEKHGECGSALILSMDLMGVSEEEQKQLAVLVRYHEGGEPRPEDEQYRALSRKGRLAVSKLLAVLQLANAMDCSHKQKLYELSARLEGDVFILRAHAKENAMLEEWVFQQSGSLFHEVFGLKPQLSVRRNKMN